MILPVTTSRVVYFETFTALSIGHRAFAAIRVDEGAPRDQINLACYQTSLIHHESGMGNKAMIGYT